MLLCFERVLAAGEGWCWGPDRKRIHKSTEAPTVCLATRIGLWYSLREMVVLHKKEQKTLLKHRKKEIVGRELLYLSAIVGTVFGIEMRGSTEQSLEEKLWLYYLKNWANF